MLFNAKFTGVPSIKRANSPLAKTASENGAKIDSENSDASSEFLVRRSRAKRGEVGSMRQKTHFAHKTYIRCAGSYRFLFLERLGMFSQPLLVLRNNESAALSFAGRNGLGTGNRDDRHGDAARRSSIVAFQQRTVRPAMPGIHRFMLRAMDLIILGCSFQTIPLSVPFLVLHRPPFVVCTMILPQSVVIHVRGIPFRVCALCKNRRRFLSWRLGSRHQRSREDTAENKGCAQCEMRDVFHRKKGEEDSAP